MKKRSALKITLITLLVIVVAALSVVFFWPHELRDLVKDYDTITSVYALEWTGASDLELRSTSENIGPLLDYLGGVKLCLAMSPPAEYSVKVNEEYPFLEGRDEHGKRILTCQIHPGYVLIEGTCYWVVEPKSLAGIHDILVDS